MGDATLDNVGRYVPHEFPLLAAEERTYRRFLRPGMAVLDLGCGNGRVARQLVDRGLRVSACDLNLPALVEFRRSLEDPRTVGIVCADARWLPMRSGAWDAVIFAYNGLDMIAPEEERERALREIARLLKPGGVFLFTSHNPLGGVLSPRALGSLGEWRARIRRIPGLFRRYLADRRGIRLYQALPSRVIRQVRRVTGMRLVERSPTRSAGTYPWPMVTAFSAWPSYVFVKP